MPHYVQLELGRRIYRILNPGAAGQDTEKEPAFFQLTN